MQCLHVLAKMSAAKFPIDNTSIGWDIRRFHPENRLHERQRAGDAEPGSRRTRHRAVAAARHFAPGRLRSGRTGVASPDPHPRRDLAPRPTFALRPRIFEFAAWKCSQQQVTVVIAFILQRNHLKIRLCRHILYSNQAL